MGSLPSFPGWVEGMGYLLCFFIGVILMFRLLIGRVVLAGGGLGLVSNASVRRFIRAIIRGAVSYIKDQFRRGTLLI